MEKFMYMFDFDFKRNIKYYTSLIVFMCSVLIVNLIINFKNYNIVMKQKIEEKGIDNIYEIAGDFNFSNLITPLTCLIFTIGIILCIFYSVFIWEKEFRGKNKSIITFLTLPSNRSNIYTSKILNILCLVYMYIMSFILTLFVAYNIFPKYMLGNIKSIGFVQDTSEILGMWLPYKYFNFIALYVFLMVAIISLVSTLVLINKSIKLNSIMKNSIITVVLLFLSPLMFSLIFLLLLGVSLSRYPAILITVGSIITTIICYLISKDLLNNKLNF